jgi:hypothetical protein
MPDDRAVRWKDAKEEWEERFGDEKPHNGDFTAPRKEEDHRPTGLEPPRVIDREVRHRGCLFSGFTAELLPNHFQAEAEEARWRLLQRERWLIHARETGAQVTNAKHALGVGNLAGPFGKGWELGLVRASAKAVQPPCVC